MSAELEVHSQEYVTHLHGSKALGAQPYCPTIQYLPRILANTSAGAKVIRPRLGASRSRESASSALRTLLSSARRLPSDCAAVCTHYLGNGGPLSARSLARHLSLAAFYDAKNANGKFLGGRGSSLYCARTHFASGEENTHTHILSEVKAHRIDASCLLFVGHAGGEGAGHVAEEAEGPDEVDGVDLDADVARQVDLRGAEDGDGEAVGDVAQPRGRHQEAVEAALLRAEGEHVHAHRAGALAACEQEQVWSGDLLTACLTICTIVPLND